MKSLGIIICHSQSADGNLGNCTQCLDERVDGDGVSSVMHNQTVLPTSTSVSMGIILCSRKVDWSQLESFLKLAPLGGTNVGIDG